MHATAVLLGDRGLLITGAPGSGKTTLAWTLLEIFERRGQFARLVSDDQVFLAAAPGGLVCSAPPAIAGHIEVRGSVPASLPHAPRMLVDLLVRLVPPTEAPRYQEPTPSVVLGMGVPSLVLPAGSAWSAALAITSCLATGPFRNVRSS